MDEREQQLVEAAMRYVELLEQGTLVNIQEYVQTVDPALRDDLAEDLELLLALGRPTEPIVLSPQAQERVDRALERSRQREREWIAAQTSQSLTDLRKARGLSIGAVARQIDLPVDLLHRIERGGVRAATIPAQLLQHLAAVLQQAEGTIQAALAGPGLNTTGVRLSAQDGTDVPADEVVDFADALAMSSATDQQREAWL